MTEQQTRHIIHLTDKFADLAYHKYEAGTREHGGLLTDVDILPLLYNLREEVIDSFVYLQTAIDAIEAKHVVEQ